MHAVDGAVVVRGVRLLYVLDVTSNELGEGMSLTYTVGTTCSSVLSITCAFVKRAVS